MGIQISYARLFVYKPPNTSTEFDDADLRVPGADIQSVEVKERASSLIDTGKVVLTDAPGTYFEDITAGDRIEFWAGVASGPGYGEAYALDYRTGGHTDLRWTGYVRDVKVTETTGTQPNRVTLDAADFVTQILNTREVFNSFEEMEISGHKNAILNRVLANTCPDVTHEYIEDIPTTHTVSWDGITVLEAVRELADVADALVAQYRTSLVFRPLDAVTPEFTLHSKDRGLLEVTRDDTELQNQVRVEGGMGTRPDDSQETVAGYYRVTSDDRLTVQLSTVKSRTPRVDVWVREAGTGDGVTVRIQNDDGAGNPVDVSSPEKDIVKRSINSHFLSDDSFTTFRMRPANENHDRDPWLIIESSGTDGQDIGVDGSDVPAFIQYYGYPTVAQVDDITSQEKYRRRDSTYHRGDLTFQKELYRHGQAVLRHRNQPEVAASFPALSPAAHALYAGSVVRLEEELLTADLLVTEREMTFDGGTNRLATTITGQDVDTI